MQFYEDLVDEGTQAKLNYFNYNEEYANSGTLPTISHLIEVQAHLNTVVKYKKYFSVLLLFDLLKTLAD